MILYLASLINETKVKGNESQNFSLTFRINAPNCFCQSSKKIVQLFISVIKQA